MSLGEPRGRAGMLGGEAIERLDEDAARAFRLGTEESADGHLETDLMTEDRFLGEAASVAAMNPPSLVAADGTGCVGVGRRDPESQGDAIEVGPDQATADGARRSWERSKEGLQGNGTDEFTERDNLSTLLDHQKCGRTTFTGSVPGCFGSRIGSPW